MAAKFLATFACVIAVTSAIAVPTAPIAKYALPALPVAKYAVPALPVQKYAVSTLPVQKYAVPTLPVQKYVAPVAKLAYAEPEAPAYYNYEYSINDQHSGDVKEQKESRNGDAVQGYYSFIQPDGLQRIVEYTSDKVHGFNAIVRYEGQRTAAPAPVAKLAYAAAPVAKITYAPTPLSYAPAPAALTYAPAPLHHVQAPANLVKVASAPALLSYATPTKHAYSENLGHVTYSSPTFSYQH